MGLCHAEERHQTLASGMRDVQRTAVQRCQAGLIMHSSPLHIICHTFSRVSADTLSGATSRQRYKNGSYNHPCFALLGPGDLLGRHPACSANTAPSTIQHYGPYEAKIRQRHKAVFCLVVLHEQL